MKKKKMLGIGMILFAVLIVGASILYNAMKDKVEDNSFQIAGDKADENSTSNTNDIDTNGTETNTDNDKVVAPDFTMTDKDGNEVKLSNFSGKPIVLNFWASWCGPCQMEMPDFEEMYKTYGEDIQFLMVNMTDGSQETVGSATQFIMEKGYTFPVYYDTKMEGAYYYSVYSLPTTYFIDAEGYVTASNKGMISGENLQKGIEAIR
jgi:thiol-disulfide isomerase/thioredoxin